MRAGLRRPGEDPHQSHREAEACQDQDQETQEEHTRGISHCQEQIDCDNIVTQDESARNAAKHAIEDSSEKIDKTKRELEKHENELAEAERALEEIRDSLKGKQCHDLMPPSI